MTTSPLGAGNQLIKGAVRVAGRAPPRHLAPVLNKQPANPRYYKHKTIRAS